MDQQGLFDYVPEQTEEILFENEYAYSHNMIREFSFYMFFKQKRKLVLSVLFALVGVLSLAILSLQIAFFKSVNPLFLVLLMIAIAYFVFVIWCYRTSVRLSDQKTKEIDLNEHHLNLHSITQNTIFHTFTEKKHEISFDQISKVILTKSFIYLPTKQGICMILKKDGFTKGTYQDFCAFLRAKGFQVKD